MENVASTVMITTTEYESLKAKEAEFEKLEALVKYYEEQLRLAKHRQFASSSEKGEVPEQLGLFDEAENTADPNQPEPDIEEITYKRRKRIGNTVIGSQPFWGRTRSFEDFFLISQPLDVRILGMRMPPLLAEHALCRVTETGGLSSGCFFST